VNRINLRFFRQLSGDAMQLNRRAFTWMRRDFNVSPTDASPMTSQCLEDGLLGRPPAREMARRVGPLSTVVNLGCREDTL
tara:strand:- start:2163 stop:2402 length:240 start_codon:yes stop_codon:yes gene_type:complete